MSLKKIDQNKDESFQQPQRRKYSKISTNTRLKLIDMVVGKQIKLPKAAKHLKINISTAKMIIKTFKKKGKIFQKRSERNKVQIQGKQQAAPLKIQQNVKSQYQVKIQNQINQPNNFNPFCTYPYLFIPPFFTFH